MNETAIIENVNALIQWGLLAVGVASVAVRALGALTAVTPWTWDDEGLNKAGKSIAFIQRVLNAVALNWGRNNSHGGNK